MATRRRCRETHRFVGPVVLHEDVLSSVLSSVREQHYYLIAVCSGDIRLLAGHKEEKAAVATAIHFNDQSDGSRTRTYIQQLVKGKVEARLVVGGAFSLHLLHRVLEDLLVAHVSLDQMLEAGYHRLGLLVELQHGEGCQRELRPDQSHWTEWKQWERLFTRATLT